jgi:hypothetical protein
MIGGIDIDLLSRAGDRSVEVAVRAVRQYWPLAVYENPETADRYEFFSEIPFRGLSELFIYRDSQSADEWDEHGAVPRLANTMIHVIADADRLTIVVDDKNAQMNRLIEDLAAALVDEVLFLSADRVPPDLEAA